MGSCLEYGWCAESTLACTSAHTKCLRWPFLSTSLLCGKHANSRRERRNLEGTDQLIPNPQGFCFSNLGYNPTHKRMLTATEQKGNLTLHLALPLAGPSPIPLPTKVMVACTTCRKTKRYIDKSPIMVGDFNTSFCN